MTRWILLGAVVLGLAACGGSRDRSPGTRTGGAARDAGGGTRVDAGTASDAGSARDGGVAPGPLPPPDTLLEDLEGQELAAICAYVVDAQGQAPATCEGDVMVTPTDFEECVQGDIVGGTCRVRDLTACMDSLEGDLCRLLETPACQALVACATGE